MSVCVPVVGTVKLSDAVAGEPGLTLAVPSETPSSMMVTVPLGSVESVAEGEMSAVT